MKPIISPNIRVRHPGHFEVGEGSVIDDFSYFSTRVRVGACCHIASCCTVAGGEARLFQLGDFSSVSAGARIWCASDDFARGLVALAPPGVPDVREHVIAGDVLFERYTAVGANAVVMPDNHVPEGTVIGALSFVPPRFAFRPWSVYAGAPIRLLRPRERDAVLRQADRLREALARHKRDDLLLLAGGP
jgi:acetyltransferase-like isoleucine patch superfamily enzyme